MIVAHITVHSLCNTKVKRIRLRNGRTSWLCPTCERTIAPTELGSADEEKALLARSDVFDLMMVITNEDAYEFLDYYTTVYEQLQPTADDVLPVLLRRFAHYLKGKVSGREAKDAT